MKFPLNRCHDFTFHVSLVTNMYVSNAHVSLVVVILVIMVMMVVVAMDFFFDYLNIILGKNGKFCVFEEKNAAITKQI